MQSPVNNFFVPDTGSGKNDKYTVAATRTSARSKRLCDTMLVEMGTVSTYRPFGNGRERCFA